MKSIIFAAALPFLAISAAPALAQTADSRPITGYGTLGYSHSDRGISDLGGVTGRLGLRFGRIIGAEAEGTFGVTDDDSRRLGVPTETKLDRSMAAYVVAYAPISQRLDLFARAGLGNTRVKMTGLASTVTTRHDSINYGVGAQYFLTGNDGIRADITRESYRHGPGRADTYGVSYVRKF
jgi:outer membrane immunogenic protein